jgi:NAD(P)-dependent dehydrogenase (short-subunit alcohol dehydrogenase family)
VTTPSRTALVTGAGRGIGRAVATRLAAEGHRVALAARSRTDLEATAAECARAAGSTGTTLVVPTDLTAVGAVDDLFATVEAELGPVEILVANAGAATSAPLRRTTDEQWRRMLDLNLTVPFQCLRRAVGPMTTAGYGRIVVVASVAAKHGEPYVAAYTAAKHGVLGLVRSAAAELARTGVTVNAVCPAYVDTPMTDATVASIMDTTGRTETEVRRILADKQPIGRLITVDEVAEAVWFCVGNAAFTGQSLSVDGGAVQS